MTDAAEKGLSSDVAGLASTRDLVNRLVRERLQGYFGRIVLALTCMAVVSAATAGNAWLMQPALDGVFIQRDETLLYLIPLGILGLTILMGGGAYIQTIQMEFVGQRVVADFQRDMYARLMRADLGFFVNTSTGNLIARFTSDAQLLRITLVRSLTGLVRDLLLLIFLIGLMFYQDWLMATIAFTIFPIAIYPIVSIGRRMRKATAATQARLADLTTRLDESFPAARLIKAYGMERNEIGRATEIIEQVFRRAYRATRINAISRPVMEMLGGAAIAGVIFFGGSMVLAGTTTPGTFFSFITALLLSYRPLKSIAGLNNTLQEGLAAAQRVFAIIDIEPEIHDAPGARPLVPGKSEIRFDRVGFAYSPGIAAIEEIDLTVPAGRTVALVGPSGSGKSTILNLIPRFYDADAGTVRVDGQDVRDLTLASLRASIALVSQEVMLFDDTIRENIAYGRVEAPMADIVEAARNAGAHDFIESFPKGYETTVGELGAKLSGGQRQRISIARAMLKNAPILLLDEATSALDTESEREVRDALNRLKQGRTTLVIAHRLSTVIDSDLIYVLERGRVIEAGTHGELLARNGAYARQYSLQFADLSQPEEPRRAAAAGDGR